MRTVRSRSDFSRAATACRETPIRRPRSALLMPSADRTDFTHPSRGGAGSTSTCWRRWSRALLADRQIPLTRQPLPVASDSLVGHSLRGRGGVPRGRGLITRAEISPPPVMRTLLFTGSYVHPSEQGNIRWPVSQLTPMNHPGQPVDEQRVREPVVRPSMFPDWDHTTKPSSTRPSGVTGIFAGQEPGLSLCSCAEVDMAPE